jgi:hypothetical protein
MLGFQRYISNGMFRIARAFVLFAYGCLFLLLILVDWFQVWIQKGRKELIALRRIGTALLLGRTHDHSTTLLSTNLGPT